MPALRERIAANLASFPIVAVEGPDLRRAAVAIMLSPHGGETTYMLTRRALTMRRGAGNLALPGGNREAGEDAVDAAIRELAEELGVIIGREALLGRLDDFVTLGGHVVTPVVLWSATPLALTPDPTEVHEAWHEPLVHLDHPDAPMREAHPDGGEAILRMFVRGHWINPPTAAWLYQFREVALHGRATRVNAVGQPAWTAR